MKTDFQALTAKKNSVELSVLILEKEDLKQKSKQSILSHFDAELSSLILAEIKRTNFSAEDGSELLVSASLKNKPTRVLVIGHSSDLEDELDYIEQIRVLGAKVYAACSKHKLKSVALINQVIDFSDLILCEALIEGVELASYSYNNYKSKKKKEFPGIEKLTIFSTTKPKANSQALVQSFCDATKFARDLVNMPAGDCSPTYMTKTARAVAKKSSLKLQVYDKAALKRMGANGLLSVSAGSSEPPYLLKLTYKPKVKSNRKIALVGKGVTFDSGGLSIKSGPSMATMKLDMSGAAAVLATMSVLSKLKPKVEVRAYIPVCENMINGSATKPGDIIKAINGKTIEILNTDAEGRLILSDALCLAVQEKSDEIIDLATLTGACMVALGTEYAGLFSNDARLAEDLQYAGELSGERLWPMPLAKEYKKLIESSIADIQNIGSVSYGGAITAALFLEEFVADTTWAHLDIAGPAYSEKITEYKTKGGVGFGVRTLLRYLQMQS